MSGDQNNDVKIPAVFLFYKEGKVLFEAMQNSNNQLEILMGARAVNSKFKFRKYFLLLLFSYILNVYVDNHIM